MIDEKLIITLTNLDYVRALLKLELNYTNKDIKDKVSNKNTPYLEFKYKDILFRVEWFPNALKNGKVTKHNHFWIGSELGTKTFEDANDIIKYLKSVEKISKTNIENDKIDLDYDTDESIASKTDSNIGLEYQDDNWEELIDAKLEEKASIDWNNYLTPGEIEKFLSRDDKIESAEDIIYDRDGNLWTKYGKEFKQNGWTKLELVHDLADFYYKDHLITENKILYHGSPNKDISTLEIAVQDTTGDQYGRGIYLTTNIDEAKQYAGSDGRVYKVDIDNLKLFNTKNKLTSSMKIYIKDLIKNDKNILNLICRYNRKIYIPKDNKDGIAFLHSKKDEFTKRDNRYLGNMPKVVKQDNIPVVSYTDYEDIDGALDKITLDDIHSCLQAEYDPSLFVNMIIKSDYDGIITHNETWYIIYRNEHKVKITEAKSKIEEVSRNELLSKAKKQTITRYNKSPAYKGFSIEDIDTTSILTTNCLRVTCKVGDYWDTVEMQNILYWIQIEADKNKDHQINTKGITTAIMNAIDGMDIKVDCTCGDFVYRFAYLATKMGYKYGKPENRPAKITNPHDYGAICKHLISMLSNKKWLQQITSTVMDYIVKRIEEVNRFLRPRKGEEYTLPNELARSMAKTGYYSKLFKIQDAEEEDIDNTNNESDNKNDNVNDSNSSDDSNNIDQNSNDAGNGNNNTDNNNNIK